MADGLNTPQKILVGELVNIAKGVDKVDYIQIKGTIRSIEKNYELDQDFEFEAQRPTAYFTIKRFFEGYKEKPIVWTCEKPTSP